MRTDVTLFKKIIEADFSFDYDFEPFCLKLEKRECWSGSTVEINKPKLGWKVNMTRHTESINFLDYETRRLIC